MSCQFLYRSRWRTTHREVRAERVAKDVHAPMQQRCPSGRTTHVALHHPLSERTTIAPTDYQRTEQVTMRMQRRCQPHR